jgi:hypothetical protein
VFGLVGTGGAALGGWLIGTPSLLLQLLLLLLLLDPKRTLLK